MVAPQEEEVLGILDLPTDQSMYSLKLVDICSLNENDHMPGPKHGLQRVVDMISHLRLQMGLVGEEEADRLQAPLAPINVVAQEEVVRLHLSMLIFDRESRTRACGGNPPLSKIRRRS